MPRDEPETITKKIRCTRAIAKCVDKKNRKLYDKEFLLPGTYDTLDKELEIIKQKDTDNDLALTIIAHEKGYATVQMDVPTFTSKAKLLKRRKLQ